MLYYWQVWRRRFRRWLTGSVPYSPPLMTAAEYEEVKRLAASGEKVRAQQMILAAYERARNAPHR